MDEISKADPAMFSPDEKLIGRYSDMVRNVTNIKPELYTQYNVKRGLRNADGSGVLVGLTSVGSVIGYGMFEQEIQPVPGLLLYRGIDVRDLVKGCQADNRLGYEETVFLLLFGRLPSQSEHEEFFHLLNELRPLPKNFKEEAIIHLASPDVMNKLKDKFPQTELFRVADKFGSWPEVMKTHFTSGGELDKLLAAGRN